MNTTTNNFIEDPEKEYDPTTYVPHTPSHGTKEVWKIFWILLFLTLIDVAIYFAWQPPTTARHITFIILGIVKGVYIMAYFMHLKYETKKLILSIVIPLLFIIWLIMLVIYEGAALEHINYIR